MTFTSELGRDAVQMTSSRSSNLALVYAGPLTMLCRTDSARRVSMTQATRLQSGLAVLIRFTSLGEINPITRRRAALGNDLHMTNYLGRRPTPVQAVGVRQHGRLGLSHPFIEVDGESTMGSAASITQANGHTEVLYADDLFRFYHAAGQGMRALRGISLRLYPSELVAVVGVSGAASYSKRATYWPRYGPGVRPQPTCGLELGGGAETAFRGIVGQPSTARDGGTSAGHVARAGGRRGG